VMVPDTAHKSHAETAPQTIASPTKVVFQKPSYGSSTDRRFSNTSTTSTGTASDESEEPYEQDWTTTTADKDTWAARETRRRSLFHKIEAYPKASHHASTSPPTSPDLLSISPRTERRGSILSLWSTGKDKDGNAVLHSDDHGDWMEEVRAAKREKEARKKAERAARAEANRGSILSLWKRGKDEHGNDVILSGEDQRKFEGEAEIIKKENEKRLRIEKMEKIKKQMEVLQLELEQEEAEHANLMAAQTNGNVNVVVIGDKVAVGGGG